MTSNEPDDHDDDDDDDPTYWTSLTEGMGSLQLGARGGPGVSFLGECGASVCLVRGCYLCGAGVDGVGRGALHGSQRRK